MAPLCRGKHPGPFGWLILLAAVCYCCAEEPLQCAERGLALGHPAVVSWGGRDPKLRTAWGAVSVVTPARTALQAPGPSCRRSPVLAPRSQHAPSRLCSAPCRSASSTARSVLTSRQLCHLIQVRLDGLGRQAADPMQSCRRSTVSMPCTRQAGCTCTHLVCCYHHCSCSTQPRQPERHAHPSAQYCRLDIRVERAAGRQW